MSFNKAIDSGQEHRKPFRRSQIFDKTCRNHGSCPYCKRNRLFKFNKEVKRTKAEIKDYYDNRNT